MNERTRFHLPLSSLAIAAGILVATGCSNPATDPEIEPGDTVDYAALVAAGCSAPNATVVVTAQSSQVTSPVHPDNPLTFCLDGLSADDHFSFGYPWRGSPDAYTSVVTGAAKVASSGETCISAPDETQLLHDQSNGPQEHRIELALGSYFFWVTWDNGGQREWSCASFEIVDQVESPPTCGDAICAADETCQSCATDCGVCPNPDLCENVECNNGTCSAGICTCDVGYTGADCLACAAGFEMRNGTCQPIVSDPCAGVMCGNGTCNAGSCTCDTGYAGATCEECAPGFEAQGDQCVMPTPTGWPTEVPAPWSGWDVLPASSSSMGDPGGDDFTVSCTGSPGNLAGLTAAAPLTGGRDGIITIQADYCVIHDISLVGYTVRVSGDHYVVRDVDIDGNGDTTKNGLRLSGTNAVAYRVNSHHLMGNDRHCFTTGAGARDMWFIENEGHACSGDGFQAGHRAEANRPTNIYIVRNHMHDNRENGLDYKYMENVWAVENTLHGFANAQAGTWCFPDRPSVCSTSNSGSDGSAVVIGSDGGPIDSFHYRNTIYDAVNAIRIESAFGQIQLEGNELRDVSGRCLALDKDGMNIGFIGNTCRNAGRGIFQNWRDNFSLRVEANTFDSVSGPAIEYEQGVVVNASTLVGNTFIASGPVVYNNTSAQSESEINALPGASGNSVAP